MYFIIAIISMIQIGYASKNLAVPYDWGYVILSLLRLYHLVIYFSALIQGKYCSETYMYIRCERGKIG